MTAWIRRINLFWTFVVLLAFHLLLYAMNGTDNWVATAVMASIVDTAALGAVQLILGAYSRQRGR